MSLYLQTGGISNPPCPWVGLPEADAEMRIHVHAINLKKYSQENLIRAWRKRNRKGEEAKHVCNFWQHLVEGCFGMIRQGNSECKLRLRVCLCSHVGQPLGRDCPWLAGGGGQQGCVRVKASGRVASSLRARAKQSRGPHRPLPQMFMYSHKCLCTWAPRSPVRLTQKN